MKIIHEHVMVRVPSIFCDESKFKGVDGKSLLIDVTFNPEQHVRNYGEVVSVPDDLFEYPIATNHIGLPSYHDYPTYSWKTVADIPLEVCEGDKVYFHPNCLLPDVADQRYNKMYMFSKNEDGKMYHYFKVKYELIFAAVRFEPINTLTAPWSWKKEADLKPHIRTNGQKRYYYTDEHGHDQIYEKKVVMVGSYVMVEPDLETWDDISIPTPETINGKILLDKNGQTIYKPKEQWLVTKAMPQDHYLRGWVRYVGTPLQGDKPFLKPGNYVFFQRFADTKMVFEGFTFFRMRQRHIFAIQHNKQITYESV
jgi:hypothetical protein